MSHSRNSTDLISLRKQAGIYLHTPFCRKKCVYCAFYSSPPAPGEVERFIAAARCELRQAATLSMQRDLRFQSVFFGGGTPPLLGLDGLRCLLDDCFRLFAFADKELELSIEVNPGALRADEFQELRRIGFNRVSIGVQSFDDNELKRIGRIHDGAGACAAIRNARRAGFNNLNLDLMYALPGQSLENWKHNLRRALTFAPEHLSLYELTAEEGTPLYSWKDQLPHEDEVLLMMHATEKILSGTSLAPYEISNYAIPGHQCQHNLNYWHNGFWLGIGPGAVSSVDNKKIANKEDISLYLDHLEAGKVPERSIDELDLETAFRETVIMTLRLRNGIPLSELRQRFGLDVLEYYGKTMGELMEKGLLVARDGRIALTPAARPLANQVMELLV